MITFKKGQDLDFSPYYEVYIDGEYVDYIGVAYDEEIFGEGWQNGSSEIADIIGGGFTFKGIKQAFIDNESRIKRVTH